MTVHRDKVDQARVNMLKTIRAAVRLKHSINADEELNEVLPEAVKKFNAAIQRGQLPSPIDVKKALGL